MGEYHRFVPMHVAIDYLRVGWVARATLDGTHHGEWAVHVQWLCACPPVVPVHGR